MQHEGRTVTRRSFREFFGAEQIELNADFSAWHGADVALATGWQTVARVLLLHDVASRAYLVQDHEPDFYATSAESLWAAQTYREDLHCVAASAWLAELLRERYGASSTHFDLAVDHGLYRPERRALRSLRRWPAQRSGRLLCARDHPATSGAAGVDGLGRAPPQAAGRRDRPLRRRPAARRAIPASQRRRPRFRAPCRALPRSDGRHRPLTHQPLARRARDDGLRAAVRGARERIDAEDLRRETASQRLLPQTRSPSARRCRSCSRTQRARANASARGIELMAERTWEHAAAQVEHGLRVALGTGARPAR